MQIFRQISDYSKDRQGFSRYIARRDFGAYSSRVYAYHNIPSHDSEVAYPFVKRSCKACDLQGDICASSRKLPHQFFSFGEFSDF